MEFEGVTIDWLGHASFRFKKDVVIYIDPFKLKGAIEKADIILITHSHYDHCSLEDVEKLIKEDTIVLGPVDVQSKIAKLGDVKFQMLHPGDTVKLKGAIIKGFPAYNVGKPFHPKQNSWLGYLIEIGGVRLYHAGDTDAIPELKQLTGLDVMLLPVGGTYTMNAEEAAAIANAVMPKLAIPMHYGSIVGKLSDAEKFKQLVNCPVGNV